MKRHRLWASSDWLARRAGRETSRGSRRESAWPSVPTAGRRWRIAAAGRRWWIAAAGWIATAGWIAAAGWIATAGWIAAGRRTSRRAPTAALRVRDALEATRRVRDHGFFYQETSPPDQEH